MSKYHHQYKNLESIAPFWPYYRKKQVKEPTCVLCGEKGIKNGFVTKRSRMLNAEDTVSSRRRFRCKNGHKWVEENDS